MLNCQKLMLIGAIVSAVCAALFALLAIITLEHASEVPLTVHLSRLSTMNVALMKCRPEIWEAISGLSIADGTREAARRLGMPEIPYGASTTVFLDVAEEACR